MKSTTADRESEQSANLDCSVRVTGAMQLWVTPAAKLAEHGIISPLGPESFRAQVRHLNGSMEWQWYSDEVGAVEWCLSEVRHITKQPYRDILPAGAVTAEVETALKRLPAWTRELK